MRICTQELVVEDYFPLGVKHVPATMRQLCNNISPVRTGQGGQCNKPTRGGEAMKQRREWMFFERSNAYLRFSAFEDNIQDLLTPNSIE